MKNSAFSGLAANAHRARVTAGGMKKDKTRAYCRRCRHEQVFVRVKIHHRLHLLFSILTLGLWSVSWLALYIGQRLRPWRCEHCSWPRPEFREDEERKAGPGERASEPGPEGG